MTGHAILSPSSSWRWLNCPPSARLEACEPDGGSEFASEGTMAHAVCAAKLLRALGRDASEAEALIESHAPGGYYCGEMEEATEEYFRLVWDTYRGVLERTPDARLEVETPLDLSRWAPDCFGTADAVIVADETLMVFDFKYGRGVKVSAKGNTQMRMYALGALDRFGFEYAIERVTMVIVQPRAGGSSHDEATANELRAWGRQQLRPAAEKAWHGEGEQRTGDWCRFCRVRPRCRAYAGKAEELSAMNGKDVMTLSAEEIAAILPGLPYLKEWCAEVEAWAERSALGGTTFPGYKLVDGARVTRQITDKEAAARALTAEGYEDDDIYKPREMKSLTALEKAIGTKKFAGICEGFIEKRRGGPKPALVAESDPRGAMTAEQINRIKTTAAFDGINTEQL